ncbi:hypothetical protein AB5I41_16865 [Sphingomonas sp. MMS24-JH45]
MCAPGRSRAPPRCWVCDHRGRRLRRLEARLGRTLFEQTPGAGADRGGRDLARAGRGDAARRRPHRRAARIGAVGIAAGQRVRRVRDMAGRRASPRFRRAASG